MITLALFLLLQGQATNQPGTIWFHIAKPVSIYYVRLSDDSFIYQMRDLNLDESWSDTWPEPEDQHTPIRLQTVCEPSLDKCNTTCCGEYGCTETLVWCGASLE